MEEKPKHYTYVEYWQVWRDDIGNYYTGGPPSCLNGCEAFGYDSRRNCFTYHLLPPNSKKISIPNWIGRIYNIMVS